MPLGGATVEDIENMQRFVAHQESMAGSHGMMVANGNLQALMEHNPMMMAMGMGGVENGMSLDPQLCSGDQYGAMVATAPMSGMPGEYPSMSGGGSGGSTGSILTEFTKRRNWSQRILEELQDFLHILTPTGKIVYASESCKALTGFAVEDLLGKFIMDYLHEDDSGLYVCFWSETLLLVLTGLLAALYATSMTRSPADEPFDYSTDSEKPTTRTPFLRHMAIRILRRRRTRIFRTTSQCAKGFS